MTSVWMPIQRSKRPEKIFPITTEAKSCDGYSRNPACLGSIQWSGRFNPPFCENSSSEPDATGGKPVRKIEKRSATGTDVSLDIPLIDWF